MSSANLSESIERIRRQLLDLSRRNRLLNYRASRLSVHIIDEQPDQVFDYLVNQGKSILFEPLPEIEDEKDAATDDSDQNIPLFEKQKTLDEERIQRTGLEKGIRVDRELPAPNEEGGRAQIKHSDNKLQTRFFPEDLEKRLYKIATNARTITQETGTNQLFLAFGFLEWQDEKTGDGNKAPLILVPVKIERRQQYDKKTKSFRYDISYTSEDLLTNLTLAEKIKREYGLILPELEEDVVPENYFKAVANSVSAKSSWSVRRELVLGFFSFSKLLMFRDLDPTRTISGTSIKDFSILQNILLGHELSGKDTLPDTYDVENVDLVRKVLLPADADSSQHCAVIDVVNGRNIVINGPPGTGKSQTITNIIGSALAQNKTVLFVAEKLAALNVVKRFLDRAGLGDFCLELHSHKVQKKQVHSEIKARLKKRYHEDDDLESTLAKLDKVRKTLSDYVSLVNRKTPPTNERIFDVLWKYESLKQQLSDTKAIRFKSISNISAEEIEDNRELLSALSTELKGQCVPKENAWFGFSCPNFIAGDESQLLDIFRDILNSVSTTTTSLKANTTKYVDSECYASLSIDELKKLCELSSVPIPNQLSITLLGNIIYLGASAHGGIGNFKSHIEAFNQCSLDQRRIIGNDAQINCDKSSVLNDHLGPVVEHLGADAPYASIAALLSIYSQIREDTAALKSVLSALPSQVILSDSLEYAGRLPRLLTALNESPRASEEIRAEVLFSDTFDSLLNQALDIHARLSETHDEFTELYFMNDMPCQDHIKELLTALRTYQDSWFPWLYKGHREALKRIRAFTRSKIARTSKHALRLLESLYAFNEEMAKYEGNPEYIDAFGSLFSGAATKWDLIQSVHMWAEELIEACGDRRQARKICTVRHPENDVTTIKLLSERIVLNLGIVEKHTEKGLLNDADKDGAAASLDDIICAANSNHEAYTRAASVISRVSPVLLDATLGDISEALTASVHGCELYKHLTNNPLYESLIGPEYCGTNTDLSLIDNTIAYAEIISPKAPQRAIFDLIGNNYVQYMDSLSSISSAVVAQLNQAAESWRRLTDLGKIDLYRVFGLDFATVPISQLVEKVSLWNRSIDSLGTWSDFCRLADRANSKGLDIFIEMVELGDIDSNLVSEAYLFAIYDSLARQVIQNNPTLAEFSRSSHEQKIKQFRNLEEKYRKATQCRIAALAAQRTPPIGVSRGPVKTWTNLALLKREMEKQRAHISIRELVIRAGNALQAIKPCFMMSPISVAQYLPLGNIVFDLMVIDEASQVPTADALGAILRSKQVVVVGDPNQLPPTPFFQKTALVINDELDESEEMAIEDSEAILDACLAANMPSRRLKWHYRSEHESLIAFSNTQFYEGELVLFPSPDNTKKLIGVKSVYIGNSCYESSRNKKEADIVARAIADHAKSYPELSLGVGAFNIEQKDLIEDYLEKMRRDDHALDEALLKLAGAHGGDEPLIIKNLENLQAFDSNKRLATIERHDY